MIDTHGEDVVACLEVGRHIVEERREARGTIAEQVAVEIDGGAVVDGFEVDIRIDPLGPPHPLYPPNSGGRIPA